MIKPLAGEVCQVEQVEGWTRDQMAALAAADIADGSYVNLGIGIPELIAQHIPPDREIVLHTENGLLGMGPAPDPQAVDPDLINAGKKPVTALPGASFFHHADSFAMIRGGHLDLCVLGAIEVAASGDLANWSTGATDAVPAVGGAMDLVSGVKAVHILTSHCTKEGSPKLVERCTRPLTGKGVVNRVYTNLAIFDIAACIDADINSGSFNLVCLAPGVDLSDVIERTAAPVNDIRPKDERTWT